MADGQILITAIGANLTRDMDMFGSQDPYCVIKFGEQDFKTDVDDKEGLTPKWNKSFTIDYFQQGNTIQIEIWDEDPGSDDLIGKTTLNLKDYINDEDEDGIKAVELFNGNDSVGQFNFTISFRQYDNQQEEEEEEEVDEEEIDESYITPEGPGTIIIKPLKAQLEVDHDTFGKQDPYCVIRIGEQVQKTRPHNGGGKNPNWLGHEFPFQRLDENEILFELKDKDAMSDDEIANGSLLIDQILCAPDGSDVPLTVDLLDGGTPVGQLFLKFSFIPQEKQKQEAAGNGRLLIKPIAADLSESGQSQLSTFCICKLGSQKQKTDVRDGQNPYWGSFLPPFKKTTQTEVEVEIRHQHKKKLLGKGKFLIQEALNDENQLVQVYFESKNKLIGSCKLQVKFLPEKEVAKQYTETPRTKNKKEAEGFGGFLQDLQALQAIIQQIFFKIDTDQSGKIDQEELAEFMKQLSQQLNQPPPTQKDVKLTMKKLDENKEGEITLEQLTPYAVQLLKSPETKAFLKNNPNQQVMIQDEEANEKLCREVFATIDSNGDGYISYGEFQDFMAHLAHLCGKSRLDQNQMAQAFNLLASNEDGKITYNEMRKLISNFVYIINSQPETMPDGTLSDDPYVLKKMIKDLKKKCKVTEFGVSKSIGQAKEAKQKFEHFQKYYMDKPPEKEMRMMQELDHIHQTIKQYQLDVMRLGQRANEMAKFDKGAQLENKIRKRENILEKLTKSVMKLQTKNVAQKSKIDSINSEKEYFAQQAFELNKHYNEMKQHKLKQLQNEVGVNNMEMFNLEKQLKQKTNEANGLLDYQKNIEKLYMQACGNTGTEIDKSLVKSKVYNIQRKQFETQSKAINIIIKEKDKLIKHNVNVDRSPNPHAKKFKITNRINKKQKQKFAKEMKNIEDKIKEQQKQVLLEQRKQNKLLEGVQAKYDSLEQQVDELLNDVRFLLCEQFYARKPNWRLKIYRPNSKTQKKMGQNNQRKWSGNANKQTLQNRNKLQNKLIPYLALNQKKAQSFSP